MGNYANVLTVYHGSDEQLINVQHILEHIPITYEELGNIFFVRTNSSEQEKKIIDGLNSIAVMFAFVHIEFLDGTYVKGNGIDADKIKRIRAILISGL